MSETPSLKKEFERYGMDRAYFDAMRRRLGFNIPNNFDYFVVDATRPVHRGDTAFYDIIFTHNGSSEPIFIAKAKQFIRRPYDAFDKQYGEPKKWRNPIEQDVVFLPYFSDVVVYDHLPEFNIVLMQKLGDQDGNESLEDKLVTLHKLYSGGDKEQREAIRSQVKSYLTDVIRLSIEHSEKATHDFNRLRNLTDSQRTSIGHTKVFYDNNGELRINKPNLEFFTGRIEDYLAAIFHLRYHKTRKLLTPDSEGVPIYYLYSSPDSEAEGFRYSQRQRQLLSLLLEEKTKIEISTLARSLLSGSSEIVHFDLRSPNILIKDNGVSFCDYQKISLASRAIDPATIVFDPLVSSFGFSLDDRLSLLANTNLNENAVFDDSIWVLLRITGAQAILQCSQYSTELGSEKYKMLLQISPFYSNNIVLPNNLRFLGELLRTTNRYSNLRGIIRFLEETRRKWRRRTSPIRSQRIIDGLAHERHTQGFICDIDDSIEEQKEPNNTHNRGAIPA
ncbi:MAG: hypothetical protein AABX29_09600 [Nanoarchaeota archaeon]